MDHKAAQRPDGANEQCGARKWVGLDYEGILVSRTLQRTDLEGAALDGTSFVGATFYGYTLGPSDRFPP